MRHPGDISWDLVVQAERGAGTSDEDSTVGLTCERNTEWQIIPVSAMWAPSVLWLGDSSP